MGAERWFPQRLELPDGTKLGRLLHAGSDWQVYGVGRDASLLVVLGSLVERWDVAGLLPESAFDPFPFAETPYFLLSSGSDQRLEPVDDPLPLKSKTDGFAFASSLKETRAIEPAVSVHDAIYVERYSRLLPTFSVSEGMTDEQVLGRWLTGGVAVSATSFRRVSSLVGWLSKADVSELVGAADLTGATDEGDGGEVATREPEGTRGGLAKAEEPACIENRAGTPTFVPFELRGRPALQSFFREHVIDIVDNAERYRAMGIEFPAAIVLHGPPGCGKTFAVEKLAEYLDWPVLHVDSNSVASPYIHETSRKVGEVFEKAMDASPSMVVIDEMESYLSDRQLHQSTGLHHVEEVSEFLRRIPEAAKRRVLIIGMTNRLEMIDSAILRRGRFDHIIEVGMPSAEEIANLSDGLLARVPHDDDINPNRLGALLAGRALSDITFVVREAARLAAQAGKDSVSQADLIAALENLPGKAPKKQSIGFIR